MYINWYVVKLHFIKMLYGYKNNPSLSLMVVREACKFLIETPLSSGIIYDFGPKPLYLNVIKIYILILKNNIFNFLYYY